MELVVAWKKNILLKRVRRMKETITNIAESSSNKFLLKVTPVLSRNATLLENKIKTLNEKMKLSKVSSYLTDLDNKITRVNMMKSQIQNNTNDQSIIKEFDLIRGELLSMPAKYKEI